MTGRRKRISHGNEILIPDCHVYRHPEEKGIADQRVKQIIQYAADFPEGTKVLTHVVYAKPYEIALEVAKKHVSSSYALQGGMDHS